jgi:hypothetical protein
MFDLAASRFLLKPVLFLSQNPDPPRAHPFGRLVQPVKLFVIVIETCLSKLVARMLRRQGQTASFHTIRF